MEEENIRTRTHVPYLNKVRIYLEKEKNNMYMNIASISQVQCKFSRNVSGPNSFMWEFHIIEIDEMVFLRLF